VPQVEWKMKYILYRKLKEYANLFGQINLVFFHNYRSHHEKISAKTTITGSDDEEHSC